MHETDLNADYRAAKAAVDEHMKTWAAAELEMVDWFRAHRGVPSHMLYDAKTGAPLDPELVALEAAVDQAATDVQWCKALVVACGEAIKGASLADVIAAQGPRPSIADYVTEEN